MNYDIPASKQSIDKTIKSLQGKGYQVFLIKNSNEALEKIKKLIPKGSSVINGASKTLEQIGFSQYLKSGKSGWESLRAKIESETDPIKRAELRKMSSLSDYYLGSVHALTLDGQMLIASNTGSQIPNLSSTSPNIILIIGTQKIVPNLNEAFKRLENYVFPLEDGRMRKAFGIGSMISKILVIRDENKNMGRKVNIILVNKNLGF